MAARLGSSLRLQGRGADGDVIADAGARAAFDSCDRCSKGSLSGLSSGRRGEAGLCSLRLLWTLQSLSREGEQTKEESE